MNVRLAEPLIDYMLHADLNDLNARIIELCPLYFSLGFTFPLSKFFRNVFCIKECAPGQCTTNEYWVIICFENLNCFFKLGLFVWELFYFFKVRCYEKYAQVHVCNEKLFENFTQGDHVRHDDMLEVNERWGGNVGDDPLVPLTYCGSMSFSIDLLQFYLNSLMCD